MRPAKAVLTDQELEIMKIVWELGQATVREVYEKLLERRQIAYTTVMTMMKILEEKGHLDKTASEKAHVYTPTQPQRAVIGSMVREFVNRVFNGSAEPLLMHLAEDEKISEAELAQIARLVTGSKRKAAGRNA